MTLKTGNIWKTKKTLKTYTNQETEHQTLRTQWFGHAWITKRYIHIGLGTHSPPNVTYAMVWAIMAHHTLRTQRFVEPWVSKPLCTYELVGCVCPNRNSRSIWWSMRAQTPVYFMFGVPFVVFMVFNVFLVRPVFHVFMFVSFLFGFPCFPGPSFVCFSQGPRWRMPRVMQMTVSRGVSCFIY